MQNSDAITPGNAEKNTQVSLAIATMLFVLWGVFTFDGLVSAVNIWYISEIFNHCFIVIPMSFYLIWEKKQEIAWSERQTTLLALPFIIGQVLLYVIGIAGDIQLFQHAAMFSLLPSLMWFFLGNKISKQILFPLMFMLFSIPFGEELIPSLQEITADISVEMLSWIGIPLYRSGLFLEIPQGKFLVAEACSGISFLIASIVLGNLYAYMNLKRMRTRVFFVSLSIVFPIIANAIRVFGIIYIGYKTDMEHAVGADHLIYGWFFFAFVIICLIGLGEIIRRLEKRYLLVNFATEKPRSRNADVLSDVVVSAKRYQTEIIKVSVLVVILVFGIAKSLSLKSMATNVPPMPMIELPFSFIADVNMTSNWEPSFRDVTNETLQTLNSEHTRFAYYQAYYDGTSGELVSSQNDIFLEDKWSISGTSLRTVTDDLRFKKTELKSSFSQKIAVYSVYVIDGKRFIDDRKAKLYQVWLKLQGKPYDGFFVAVSVVEDNQASELNNQYKSDDIDTLLSVVAKAASGAFSNR